MVTIISSNQLMSFLRDEVLAPFDNVDAINADILQFCEDACNRAITHLLENQFVITDRLDRRVVRCTAHEAWGRVSIVFQAAPVEEKIWVDESPYVGRPLEIDWNPPASGRYRWHEHNIGPWRGNDERDHRTVALSQMVTLLNSDLVPSSALEL